MATPVEKYVGTELELFRDAVNWKSYVAMQIRPFLGARVLEVGAGIGGTTRFLCTGREERWLCLEPDEAQAEQLQAAAAGGELAPCCEVRAGTVAALGAGDRFDTILYIDVLEHIADDRAELAAAAAHLVRDGKIVVLAPAHPWLFSPFDAAIGHHRRYTKQTLRAAAPAELGCERLRYLDCAGVLASAANRLMMRSELPTPAQLRLWDRALIPVSRFVDSIAGYAIGKSLLGVFRSPP